MTRNSVGIVIPAYQPDIPLLSAYIDALSTVVSPDRIHIELDTTDSAESRAISAMERPDVTTNVVDGRRGKGRALTHGLSTLDTDIVAFVDADGSTDAESVRELIDRLADADMTVGSRRHPDAVVASHQTVVRRGLGDGFAWIARRVLPVKLYDYQCGAKAMWRPTWERISEYVSETGFAWDIEVLTVAGALQYRIEEVPIVWHDQPGSTVSPVRVASELAMALGQAHYQGKLISGDPVYTRAERLTQLLVWR